MAVKIRVVSYTHTKKIVARRILFATYLNHANVTNTGLHLL